MSQKVLPAQLIGMKEMLVKQKLFEKTTSLQTLVEQYYLPLTQLQKCYDLLTSEIELPEECR